MRRTKIIATVGPASDSDPMLDALIAAGADIFRLNFSHGTRETHGETFERVRRAAQRAGRHVAVLQDLAGPKIRTGPLVEKRPLRLLPGDKLVIATGDFAGGPGRISTPFVGLAATVHPGDRLLLADGTIELRVDRTDGREIETTILDGGELGEHKGITAPGITLPARAPTAKDIDDLRFGLELGVDMVALSFVQSAEDLQLVRAVMIESGRPQTPLVAKLERPQALDRLDEIVAASQAVMVARGDLGLEMPLERVPIAQKRITERARARKVPVIVATQVLESMTFGSRPTRAEVSDAANAVADGVDAIMLAGETAIGAFPAGAVETLDAILREAEAHLSTSSVVFDAREEEPKHAQAICEAAVTLAEHGKAEAIVAVTRGGATARRLSALRPHVPILAATDRQEMARRLTIYWGVSPVCADIDRDRDGNGASIGRELVSRGLLAAGVPIVLVSISPDLGRTDVNYVKIQRF